MKYITKWVETTAEVDISTNVEIDVDEIIEDVDTEDLIFYLTQRDLCKTDIEKLLALFFKKLNIHIDTLIDSEKLNFFLENFDRINLDKLERCI